MTGGIDNSYCTARLTDTWVDRFDLLQKFVGAQEFSGASCGGSSMFKFRALHVIQPHRQQSLEKMDRDVNSQLVVSNTGKPRTCH